MHQLLSAPSLLLFQAGAQVPQKTAGTLRVLCTNNKHDNHNYTTEKVNNLNKTELYWRHFIKRHEISRKVNVIRLATNNVD